MLAIVLLGSLARAADGVVLVLPATEPPGAWAAAAELGRLHLGADGPGAQIRLEAGGPSWRVVARDLDGNRTTLTILAPRTLEEREDAVLLAVSLLAALPSPPRLGPEVEIVPAPMAHPKPQRAPPRPARPPPASRALEPEAPPVDGPLDASPSPDAPEVNLDSLLVGMVHLTPPAASAQPPASPSVRALVRAGPLLSFGPAERVSPGLELGLGLELGERVWLGLDGIVSGERALDGLPAEVEMRALDAGLRLGWSPPTRLAPVLGLGAGLSWRDYAQEGDDLGETRVAVVTGEAGLALRLTPTIALASMGRLGVDLDTTWIEPVNGPPLAQPAVRGSGAILVLTHFP